MPAFAFLSFDVGPSVFPLMTTCGLQVDDNLLSFCSWMSAVGCAGFRKVMEVMRTPSIWDPHYLVLWVKTLRLLLAGVEFKRVECGADKLSWKRERGVTLSTYNWEPWRVHQWGRRSWEKIFPKRGKAMERTRILLLEFYLVRPSVAMGLFYSHLCQRAPSLNPSLRCYLPTDPPGWPSSHADAVYFWLF